MDCPKCNSGSYVKDGNLRGLQRYKCKGCNFRYTVLRKSDVKSIETKRLALELYLEGLGFRAIGRYLKVSHVSVYNWIRSWGEKAEELKSGQEISVMELDEMHTYIGSKKTTAGYGLLLIDMANGSSIMCVDAEVQQQEKSFGEKSKVKQ